MDFIDAEPFGFNHEQRDKDDKMCRDTERELIHILSEVLNKFHGVNHSPRYWRIICGHWLRLYVDVIFNRYSTLQLCIERHKIGSIICFEDDKFGLATANTSEFITISGDDVWNSVLYSMLLSFIGSYSIDKTVVKTDGLRWGINPVNQKITFRRNIIKKIKKITHSILSILSKDTDAIITNTYLPYFEELKLNLALKQLPVNYVTPVLCASRPDLILRRSLADDLQIEDKAGYSKCALGLLFEMIPTCFLEDYKMMSVAVEEMNWPRNPRFIFTSNDYYANEFFKFMTAKQVERNTPYYVGQHGNFGTDNTNYPSVDMLTCDKYLRWGCASLIPQEVPAFVFKLANKKPISPDNNGDLLFILDCQTRRRFIWDNTYRHICIVKGGITFYKQLDNEVKKYAVIRPHSAMSIFSQYEDERWQEVDNNIRISNNESTLDSLLKRSRIAVFSYNSSGFFECLSQNFPTLALIDDIGFIHESVRHDYKKLADLGIIHFSPLSAAQKVNSVWNNLDEWWMNPEIQNASKLFCDKFSRQSKSPISDIMEIFDEK